MLNAKNISEIIAFLKLLESSSVEEWRDPRFIGTRQAEAFILSLELKMALADINLEISTEE
jgi:hypothetical protein